MSETPEDRDNSNDMDAEIEALITLVRELEPFSDEGRQRMLEYLRARFLREQK